MTINGSNKARHKSTMFFTFLVKSLQREKPELVNDINYIIAQHKRQVSGFQNIAAIITQLNTLVGEDSWSTFYFEFLKDWRAQEKAHLRDAMLAASTSAQATGIVQPDGPQSKTATIEGSSKVIDLTDDAVETNDLATATASADAAGKSQNDDKFPLPTILTTKSGNPTAISRRLNLPVHTKAQNRPESAGTTPPFVENVSRVPMQQQYGLPWYIIKQPSQNEIRTNRHVALMSRVQRQIKEETARSIAFVNRTLSELEAQNPQIYSQAVLVVEECLQRGSRCEMGYEHVAAQIMQRLKALLVLRDSSVFRPLARNPFNFPAPQRPFPINGKQLTTPPPAPDLEPSQAIDDKTKCDGERLKRRFASHTCEPIRSECTSERGGSDSEASWESKKEPTSPPDTFTEKKSSSFHGSPAWLPTSPIKKPDGSVEEGKSLLNSDSDGYSSSSSDNGLSVNEPSTTNNPKNSPCGPEKILSKPQYSPSNTNVIHPASQTNGPIHTASPQDLEPVSSTSSAAPSSHPSQRSYRKRGWLASSSASSLDEQIEGATRRRRICEIHSSDDIRENDSSMTSLETTRNDCPVKKSQKTASLSAKASRMKGVAKSEESGAKHDNDDSLSSDDDMENDDSEGSCSDDQRKPTAAALLKLKGMSRQI